ncbi:PaaI family thioesterase [Chloroflexota bacterium]
MSPNEASLSSERDIQVPIINLDKPAENFCFGCSKNNPIGLKLRFTEENGITKGEFTPEKFHQGWPGYTHGGILFTLLDEAGGFAVHNQGVACVTAKSEIKYIKPAEIGEQIQIQAKVLKKNKRIIEIEATLSLTDGSTIARTISQWFILKKVTH